LRNIDVSSALENRHAGFLFHQVECLNTPRLAWEPSVRFCRNAILPNRFLLTFAKKAIQHNSEETILTLCRRLQMPEVFFGTARQSLPLAKLIHFGFEENETSSLYKMYLEFDPKGILPNRSFLLHRAFKWDVADKERHVLTEYIWHRSLDVPGIMDRLEGVYQDSRSQESLAIAQEILQLAASRPGHEVAYLEVTEPTNDRRSFDLNMYDALLLVGDLYPYLLKITEHFRIPAQQFQDLFERIKCKRFGHLAGGIHRGGQDFFNLYYGVEWREGKTVAGFGDQEERNSLAQISRTSVPRNGAMLETTALPFQNGSGSIKAGDRYEITAGDDHYYNYCWWPYLPVASVENKFRPVNLLYHSFELAGLDARAYQLVQRIREAIGLFRTVWGVKWLGDRLAWEFYFYDYQRRQREVSISRVLEAIRPIIRCDVPVNESLGYFMFSLDVNGELLSGARTLDVVHMYIGNPGSRVSSGIAYALTAGPTVLENFYFFFEATRDLRQAAEKVLHSAHVDVAHIDIDRILRPELRDCNTICIANKQRNDTAYFSGVNVDQLLFFLKLLDYPAQIVGFVEANRSKLDHLLYDVGFDYVAKEDELVILKSGYYGVF